MNAGEHRRFVVTPGGSLNGDITVPGDKSISHRAVMLAMVANGTSEVSGLLRSADVEATLRCCTALGARVSGCGNDLVIEGVGDAPLKTLEQQIDLGNSGTAMRLLTGLLAGRDVTVTLTGDSSLCSRPMRRVTDPLSQMGANIKVMPNGTPPVMIGPAEHLSAIDYVLPIASAQVKSAVLLAGLNAVGTTRVIEPQVTRDHSERMLTAFGVTIDQADDTISLVGGQRLTGTTIPVPADLSSAAFFIVGALISRNSRVMLRQVGINPTRSGILHILSDMGASIKYHNQRHFGGEAVADLEVVSSELQGVSVGADLVSLAIDEIPILALAACCAEGKTTISGAEELRVKESDRISAVVNGFKALGVEIEEKPDGMIIHGSALRSGHVDSVGDHRLAMTFAMAALRCDEPVTIFDTANVATSFPGFASTAASAGLGIEEIQA